MTTSGSVAESGADQQGRPRAHVTQMDSDGQRVQDHDRAFRRRSTACLRMERSEVIGNYLSSDLDGSRSRKIDAVAERGERMLTCVSG